MLVAKNGGSSVGAVEVQPEPVLIANVSKRHDVVDGAGVRRSCGGDDAEGAMTRRSIGVNLLFQQPRIELHAFVDRNAPECFATKAEKTDGLVEGMVRFAGGVDDRLRADRRDAVVDRGREVFCQRQR